MAQSPEYLLRKLQNDFDQLGESQKRTREDNEAMRYALGVFIANNGSLAEANKQTCERAISRLKTLSSLAIHDTTSDEIHTQVSSPAFFRTPPYEFSWAPAGLNSGSAYTSQSANSQTGDIHLLAHSGEDEGHAATAGALGMPLFPSVANGLLRVAANPSISYDYCCGRSIDSVQSHGWIGLYIAEYTLQHDFVRTVVSQQFNLWMQTSDGGSKGSNGGLPLTAECPVDNNHEYENLGMGGCGCYRVRWWGF